MPVHYIHNDLWQCMSVISAVGYQENNFKSKIRLRPSSVFVDDAGDSMVSKSLVLAASALDGQVGQMCEDRDVVV